MKRKSYWLGLLALVLILTAVIHPSLAYFTANSQADGAIPLRLGYKTEIREDVKDLEKTVRIENTEGRDVWIRAIAYAGSTFTLEVSGSEWHDAAGAYITVGRNTWVYYDTPVAEHQMTGPLTVKITGIPTSDEYTMTSFNISVQYESIPVEYNEDGTPIIPTAEDWLGKKLDTGTTSPTEPTTSTE